MRVQPKSKTLLEAISTNHPSILATLANKWGVPIPVNQLSRDYWQLVVDLATHVLESGNKVELWYNNKLLNVSTSQHSIKGATCAKCHKSFGFHMFPLVGGRGTLRVCSDCLKVYPNIMRSHLPDDMFFDEGDENE